MKALKKIYNAKWIMPVLWTLIIIAVWELFATIVEFTERSPENFLPHIGEIINSVISAEKINGTQTA